jgi:hypothetical protein
MPLALGDIHSQVRLIERQALSWLVLLCVLFIVYGTFIPFRFNADPKFVHSQWTRFFTPAFVLRMKQFSITDVMSNAVLFHISDFSA